MVLVIIIHHLVKIHHNFYGSIWYYQKINIVDIKVAGKQHGLEWCIFDPIMFTEINKIFGIGIKYFRNMDLSNTKLMKIIYNYCKNRKRAFSYIDDILEPLWKFV